ncbi:hypothetical protein [Bacillus sp. AK031]
MRLMLLVKLMMIVIAVMDLPANVMKNSWSGSSLISMKIRQKEGMQGLCIDI